MLKNYNKIYKKKHLETYSVEQLELFKKAFNNCDIDKSGEISKDELRIICEKSDYAITKGSLSFMFSVSLSQS